MSRAAVLTGRTLADVATNALQVAVMLAVGFAVNDEIDKGVQIVILAVEFAIDAGQILGLHQLELVPN